MLNQFLTSKDRQAEVELQKKALNFDWYAQAGPDLQKRLAFANTVYEGIMQQIDETNPIPLIFNVRPGSLGTRIRVKEISGAKVYERAYGEFKRVSRLRASVHTITTMSRALHLEETVEELKAGIVTTSDLIEAGRLAVLRDKIGLMRTTMEAAIGTSSAYATDYGAALSQSELDTEIKAVAATKEVGAILGPMGVLQGITEFAGYDGSTGYAESVKEELHRRGMLGVYRGIPVIAIRNSQDEAYGNVDLWSTTDIWICPADRSFTRFAEEQGATQTSRVQPDDGTFHLYIDYRDGAALWKTAWFRRLYS